MPPLPGDDVRPVLARLRDGDEQAWREFLDRFAPLLLQAARAVERDQDAAGDAFVFTCQRLRERGAKRLAAFDFERPGHFETWLRAVALNLCRDARRHRRGRFRPFAAMRRLPALEQRLFTLRHDLGFNFDQAFRSLAAEFPGLTEQQLSAADSAVSAHVSARQRWTLLTRRPRLDAIDEDDDTMADSLAASQGDTDPEWRAIARESSELLAGALASLSADERLLITLRFTKGLTLARLAVMFGYRDVQTADRRIRELLKRLRTHLEGRV